MIHAMLRSTREKGSGKRVHLHLLRSAASGLED
jgi:hypothetical protein